MAVTPQDNSEFESAPDADEALGDVADVAPEDDPDLDPGDDLDTDEGETEGSTERVRLNVDEVGDHTVVVKVNGEDVEMTLKEALSGVMRQQDYTRKTQEVAAERERLASVARLAEWLEKDPVGTIRELQKAIGVEATRDLVDEAQELDPEEARLRRLEALADQQEQEARNRAIVTEATSALAAVGVEADAAELLQFAMENQIMDLTKAARFFKVEHASTVQAQETARKQAEQAELLKRKRAASAVEGGRSRTPDTSVPAKGKKVSVQEAFEAAKLSLSRS